MASKFAIHYLVKAYRRSNAKFSVIPIHLRRFVISWHSEKENFPSCPLPIDAQTNQHPKRSRGRPVEYPMPEAIDDTPENVAKAIMRKPPKKEWRYLKESGRKR